MREFVMLLVDLTTHGADPELATLLEAYFDVKRPLRDGAGATPKAASRPSVICLEFDYPDAAGLALLKRTKELYPSVPLIMVTKQHSEDLAVWAFRSRAWDFIVKPVTRDEIQYVVRRLSQIGHETSAAAKKRVLNMPSLPMPLETRARGNQSATSALLPAVLYVEDNLANRIAEQAVARLCNMSLFKFSRIFRKAYGMTFKDYVSRARIVEAMRLLENPHSSIGEVAYQVGFNDPSYFSRVFKKYAGVAPSDFRNRSVEASIAGWPTPARLILE